MLFSREKRLINIVAVFDVEKQWPLVLSFAARLQFVLKLKRQELIYITSSIPATLSETKGSDPRAQPGTRGENALRIFLKMDASELRLMFAISCHCECLLKACASRQEKPSFCNKNCASPNADIRDIAFANLVG
jgi:hypothetical protein